MPFRHWAQLIRLRFLDDFCLVYSFHICLLNSGRYVPRYVTASFIALYHSFLRNRPPCYVISLLHIFKVDMIFAVLLTNLNDNIDTGVRLYLHSAVKTYLIGNELHNHALNMFLSRSMSTEDMPFIFNQVRKRRELTIWLVFFMIVTS